MKSMKWEKCISLNSEEKGSLIVELVITIPAIMFAFFLDCLFDGERCV